MKLPKDTPLYVLADIAEEEGREEDAVVLRIKSLAPRGGGNAIRLGPNEEVIVGFNIYVRPGSLQDNETFWHGEDGWMTNKGRKGIVPASPDEIKETVNILRRALEKVNKNG